jgi:adenylate cyclase
MNGVMKSIKTCFIVFLIGISGVLFSASKPGAYLEEEYGLDWLFKLRGSLPPPPDIVLISVDKASSEILHLPDDPKKWPHNYYATLIEKINRQNPALIALNIRFDESREPAQDIQLAQAMRQQRNVMLSNYLKQSSLSDVNDRSEIYSEKIIEPIPVLKLASACSAPFPLPKSASTVKEFWAYKHAAGDIPTFPVSIFQYFFVKTAYPDLKLLLSQLNPETNNLFPASFGQLIRHYRGIEVFQEMHTLLSKDQESQEVLRQLIGERDIQPYISRLLTAWLALLGSGERLYLNYYGDVGAITTVPFYQVLAAESILDGAFKDKIVIVGFSDNIEPERNQGFYSTFSKSSGQVISPTEIAATAIANLIDQSWLKKLSPVAQTWLIFVWAVLLSAVFRFFPYRYAMTLVFLGAGIYLGFCVNKFTTGQLWLPLAVPMLLGFLVVMFESILHFVTVKKVSERYLPKDVFAVNYKNPEAMHQYGKLMHGVCMATDAGQYTALSEATKPLPLHQLMNEYYGVIFPEVKSRSGMISDVIGDAMLAVWAAKNPEQKLRIAACQSALAIKTAIDHFNRTSNFQLITRLGLHCGEMRLGNVGAKEHFEYRAVGDTINTATRIENLNKLLGTRILVSSQVIEGIEGLFLAREIGSFLVKGKSQPITVFELAGNNHNVSHQSEWNRLSFVFNEALTLYKQGDWKLALSAFSQVLKEFPDDGPSRFFISYLTQNFLETPEKTKLKDNEILDVRKIQAILH